MGKWMKILGGIGVLAVGVIVAGVAILMSQDFNEYKGLIAEKAKEATGRDLKIDGDLNLEISLNPAIAVEGVSFANASWGSRPEMVSVKKFAAEVSLIPLLSGQVVVNRLVVEGVDLLAETNKDGLGNWEFAPGAKEEAATDDGASGDAQIPAVDQVVIKDVKVTYKDGKTGEEYRVALDSMSAQAGGTSSPVKIALAGSLNEKAFDVSGTLGSIEQMTSADAVYPVDILAKALGVETSFTGKLGTPDGNIFAEGGLKLAIASLKATLADASNIVPALKDTLAPGVDEIDLTGDMKFTGDAVAINGLAFKAGATDLAGSLKATLGGTPNVDATLTSNMIDVDELLPPSKDDGTQPAETKKADDGRVFPNDPLPLDGLKAVNAKLAFDAKKIKAGGNVVDDVSVRLSLQGGNLNVKPASAVVGGAKLVANVGLNGAAKTPTLKADVKANGIDYGELLTQQGITDIASGKLDADVNVTGAGGSVRALMAGLNGKVFIKTENGKLDSNALNIVSSDVLSVLPGFNSKDDKTIKCGVVNLDIKKGIAHAKAIVFETGGLSAIGTGSANLRDETLDLLVDPRAKQTSIASAAIVPVKLVGTFAKPDYEIDAASLAVNAGSTALKGAAAVATLGLSVLVDSAVSRATGAAIDETDYCTPALAGNKVVPGEVKAAEKSDSGGAEPAKQESGEQKQEGGIGGALNSLFGSN